MITRLSVGSYMASAGAILAGLAIPISIAASNISVALLVLAGALQLASLAELKFVLRKPFVVCALLLVAILALATLWTPVSSSEAWGFVLKMRIYWLIPFLIVALHSLAAKQLLLGFAIATLISVVLSCGSAWLNYPIFKAIEGNWFIFHTHTYHNFFAGLLATGLFAGLLSRAISSKGAQITAIVVIGLCLYDVFFLVQGRSGQLTTLVMLVVVALLHKPKMGLWFSALTVVVTIGVLPSLSTNFTNRINQVGDEVSQFEQGGNADTSVGLRLQFYKNTLSLIEDKPLLGHGTGSYRHEYMKLTGFTDTVRVQGHPHNDFMFLSMQAGVLAGVLLVAMMAAAAWMGRALEPTWKYSLYALQLGMGVATLANSFFTDNITGVAYVLLTLALLAGPKKRNDV